MNPLSFARRTLLLTTVAAGLSAGAQATTLLQTTGWANGSDNVSVVGTAQPVSDSGSAGGFTGIWNGTNIVFFCDDLGHFFSVGSTFTDDYQASILSLAPGSFGNNLSRLFTEAFATGGPVATQARSVGFQLAVWEVEYETAAVPYSLSTGTFTGTSADAAAIAEANALLAGLSGFAPLYQITQLTSTLPNQFGQDHSQNFVFANSRVAAAVPEPTTLALFGLGLASIGFSRRRT